MESVPVPFRHQVKKIEKIITAAIENEINNFYGFIGVKAFCSLWACHKRTGVVRHIGLSSHTPLLVNEMLDMGILDMLMFSINPAYDYAGGTEPNYAADSYAVGSVAERMNLYRRCEAEGVGISVMKAFSGGQLLKAETSPVVS